MRDRGSSSPALAGSADTPRSFSESTFPVGSCPATWQRDGSSDYLLEVNLLLALSDPMHVYHEVAHRWFADAGSQSWATRPLTENGYVRVASHPSYPNWAVDVGTVAAILRQFCADAGHQFGVEDVSIRWLFNSKADIISQGRPAWVKKSI